MLKNVTLLLLILTTPFFLKSQTFVMDGTPIASCEGTFTDSGDTFSNYNANENLTTTICPDGTSNSHIQLTFFGIDLGTGDELCFYDGENMAAIPLTCFNATDNNQLLLVQATAANLGGCVTITFNSDATDQGAGWIGNIECINACQVIEPVLLNTEPAIMPADTGWIAVCPNQEISFSAAGNYPQNNASYTQNDATSVFAWDFGDGNTGFGQTISHQYENAGGYFVQLTITDTVGCTNTDFLNIPIRVAAAPNFAIANVFEDIVCAGDTVELSASINEINANSTVSVTANTVSSQTPFIHINSAGLPLPDGDGSSYQSTINITDFAPNQMLDNTNMLTKICVVMEHSWMRDLEIVLECPNGQSIILHDHPGQTGGQVFLGEPIDNDGGFPTPGVGYEYCWTPNSTNNTWIVYSNTNVPGTLPSQDYATFEPIADLNGCPLNGQWDLIVTDLWASDNGYLFQWSLEFDAVATAPFSFQNDFIDWNWQNVPSPIFQTMDSVAFTQNAGNQDVIFAVTDEFGCVWDTTLSMQALPPTHPDCINCNETNTITDVLADCDEPLNLEITTDFLTDLPIAFGQSPNYPFSPANHPPNMPYSSTMEVNSVFPEVLTNPTEVIASVCLDITSDFDNDIAVFLQAPNGTLLELTTNNGGGGDNYTQTCFTPTATTSIQSGSAPFTGDFQPEGDWQILADTPINGEWSLLVSDAFGITTMSILNSWEITFNASNEVNYSWQGGSLSCQNCPNPTASVPFTPSYEWSATDAYGCSESGVINVETDDNEAPEITCPSGIFTVQMSANTPPSAVVEVTALNIVTTDNCSIPTLSFAADSALESLNFTCDDLGLQVVEIWSTDAGNNQSMCEMSITVEDAANHCDNTPEIIIAGTIANSDGAGKDEIAVNLEGTTTNNFTTEEDGNFAFTDLTFEGNYTVSPTKDVDYLNGVTGFDMVKIQQHLLATEVFTSPYQSIAADANNSGSVSVLDLVAIQRLILAVVDTFPNNTSYRFVAENYEFPNPNNPWQEAFSESITYENIETSQLNTDFVALKIGDVNNSANLLAADDRNREAVYFSVKDQFVKAGMPVRVEFTAEEYYHFGHQFTLHFPNLKLINIEEGLVKTSDFGQRFIHENRLTTCWTNPIALEMEESDILFTLNFQAKNDGYLSEFLHLSSEITTNEAYAADGNIQRIDLAFANEAVDFEFKLLQNVPNPFSNKTCIGFVLPKSGNAVLTIFDANGRILKTMDKNYEKGQHQVDINYEEFGAKGLLFYQLETEMGTAFRKMVVF